MDRKHQTVASMRHEAFVEEYDFSVNERVITCDGLPGKVTAIHPGPFRGNEEYHVELDNNLGGGSYVTSQLEKESYPVESKYITAEVDYPELREVIYTRPDPAKLEFTASKKQAEFDPGLDLEAEPADYQETVQPGLKIEDIPEEKLMENIFAQSTRTAFIQAAVDQDFRFQFTSAWSDIVSKAKRIRTDGGVQITHAADGVIFGNVQGDTAVYETGIERLPNSRTGVSNWSCGCKWGAYHWGADDDLSRFAGRQCSHSLALQYEAQSRGMFGKTVSEDVDKPKWVPSRVVVKHDLDTGKNLTAHSGLSLAPSTVLYTIALRRNPELAEEIRTIASVYDPFGDSPAPQTDVNPNVPGATKKKDPLDNPASTGYATSADPGNWGSIQDNDTFSRHMSAFDGSAGHDTETTDSISSTETAGEPVGANTMGADSDTDPHILASRKEEEDEGAEAELKDDPEGALPDTTARSFMYDHPESLSPNNMDEQPSAVNTGFTTGEPERAGVKPGQESQTHETEIDDTVRQFQSEAAHLAPNSKIAVKDFTFSEQQELINEGKGSRIRNFDRLNIEGTHYAYLDEEEDDPTWLS